MRERRKSKEKISGRGATVKGKWPYYDVMNCFQYYLQHRTTNGNVPETATATATEVSFADPDETEIGNSEQLEGENISHDQKWKEGRVKRRGQQELKEVGKVKN
jgi:hypothetical protein